ncbi:MAG: ABC transporter ATP-binding protein [Acholeplasmataceae bacterium]|nr:ABC transporter ATP-binding protein [Acholeplasmataceae bacterium]
MGNLSIEHLMVRYVSDKPTVLHDINLEVKDKELVVILGNSGSGKSTLLKAISGLITPEKGSVRFAGKPFFDASRNVAVEERNIGFCFQSDALAPHMNVYHNLAFPLKIRRCPRSEISRQVDAMLDFMGMSRYKSAYPDSLSGGEKQRIALARALIYKPGLLLLDEPLASLDTSLKETLARGIRHIHDSIGITTIYVTHDQNEAFMIADRIVILNEGNIEQIGSPKELYNHPKTTFVAHFVGRINTLVIDHGLRKHLGLSDDIKEILVRPEHIFIVDNSNLRGIIRRIDFKGSVQSLLLSYGSQAILVDVDQAQQLEVGFQVLFTIGKHFTCFETGCTS